MSDLLSSRPPKEAYRLAQDMLHDILQQYEQGRIYGPDGKVLSPQLHAVVEIVQFLVERSRAQEELSGGRH